MEIVIWFVKHLGAPQYEDWGGLCFHNGFLSQTVICIFCQFQSAGGGVCPFKFRMTGACGDLHLRLVPLFGRGAS